MGDTTESGLGDFGSGLRAARTQRGISLAEIAESTKISTAILEALETNDVTALPGGIFTRSFVRSYACAVGLDPEETVQAFVTAFPTPEVTNGSGYGDEAVDHDFFTSERLIKRTAIGLFVLSVPAAAILVFLGLGDADQTELKTPEAVIELGPPRAAGAGAFSEPETAPDTVVQEEGVGQPLIIDIHPREACWVSLTLDGNRVFSRIMQPGEHEVHEARSDIILDVGNAGAFDFSINQQPGQSLGARGEAVTASIDRGNYRRFLLQQAGSVSDSTGH